MLPVMIFRLLALGQERVESALAGSVGIRKSARRSKGDLEQQKHDATLRSPSMKRSYVPALCLLWLVVASTVFALENAMREKLKRSYHTEPHTLPKGEKYDRYNAEIMAVWEEASQKPKEYGEALKSLLKEEGMIPYFYYDGATMLLSLEVTPENLQLAAASMARCDVRDVERFQYLRTMVALGASGMDVSAAALRILEEDEFQALIPDHVLVLNQDWSFMVAASQVPPSDMLKAIRKRLERPLSNRARSTLADWAWNAATTETDKLFAELWPSLPEDDDKERFQRMAKRMRPGNLSEADGKKLDELREKRKPLMGSFSDEGLDIARGATREMRILLGDIQDLENPKGGEKPAKK